MQVSRPPQAFFFSATQEKDTTSLLEIFKTVNLHNPV